MVDTHLFFSLVKAIDFSRTKFIVMGDPAQVAPVGAGQPFKDLIEMKLLPHQELTKIYRQSEDQAIAWIASQIRAGVRPEMKRSYLDVFSYRAIGNDNAQINKSIEDKIAQLAQRYKVDVNLTDSASVLNYLYYFQVITPRRTGVLGQEELSPIIRRIWLSCDADNELVEDEQPVVVKDKMIHLKNIDMKTTSNQQVKVFNGMIGVVESVDYEEDSFVVHYPIEGLKVIYSMKHVRNGTIGYAWALTIHKTQGSEYQNVVIPFSRSHWNMLNNRLTYTAVTRAKASCHLVGDVGAFSHACTSTDSMKRQTVLQILHS
jgi:exodeoxyribonuclease V alpha subunit